MPRNTVQQAKAMLSKSLAIDIELGSKVDIAEDLEELAGAAGALGQFFQAARLWGAAEAQREDSDIWWSSAERLLLEPVLTAARLRLSEAAWEIAFADGKAMRLEEAVEYALSEEQEFSATSPPPLRFNNPRPPPHPSIRPGSPPERSRYSGLWPPG